MHPSDKTKPSSKIKKACGSCWRCENVENPKAVSHNFHKRLGKLTGAKSQSAPASFPQASTRPYY
jgi:hypothetical protein